MEDLSDIAHSTVGDLTVADSIPALAADVLTPAPRKFALAGLSMVDTVYSMGHRIGKDAFLASNSPSWGASIAARIRENLRATRG